MKTNEARLKWLKEKLLLVPEGRAALDLAARMNVTIFFDESLPLDPVTRIGTSGRFLAKTGDDLTIGLNPKCSNASLVGTLAHELRHAWHHSKANFLDLDDLKPIDRLAFMRLIEGDANAFAALVTAKIRKETKARIICDMHGIITVSKHIKDKHLEPDFLMPRVFENFQNATFHNEKPSPYEEKLLDHFRQMTVNGSPYSLFKSLSETFNTVSDILRIDGSQKNYLDAKDIDDYVEKVEKMIRDDIKTEAKNYTKTRYGLFW